MNHSEESLEAAVQSVIAECGGNLLSAIRVLVVANSYLEAEADRLADAVSRGYPRKDLRRRARRVQ